MTAPLTLTAQVQLPAMQEPGPASVREAAAPAAQQAPADTSASAHGRGTDRSAAYPSAETAANTPDTAQETTHGLSGTGDSARNNTPRTALPTAPAPAQGADSLAADTLHSGPQAAASLPIFSLDGPLRGAADTLWRDAPADKVFGPASTLVPARILPAAPAPSLTENPVFQGFVLLLAATYAILLYRNLGDIRLLLTRVSHDTATGIRLMEDPGGSGFSHFLNVATAIGILFVGVMNVKYGDSLIPDSLIETLPQGAVLALSLLATFACLCVGIFQRGVVRLAGAVTLSQPFVSQLMLLKRTYFTLGVIVTVPALLLFACNRRILTAIDWAEVVNLKPLRTFFIVNRDIMLRTFCIVAVYTFFTGASARMDEPALLAVNTLLLQLFTLFSYMNDGFAYAAAALTGRFIGARDEGALRDCLRRCIAWGTVVSVLFVGIYIGWWRELVGLFVDSTAPNAATIVELAGEYIVWIILIPVASAMPFIMDGIMVGATETRVMRDSMFWATAAYFAIYYACYPLIGNNALWLAFTLYMFLRGVIQFFMTRRLKTIYDKIA